MEGKGEPRGRRDPPEVLRVQRSTPDVPFAKKKARTPSSDSLSVNVRYRTSNFKVQTNTPHASMYCPRYPYGGGYPLQWPHT